jgi:short-subunit dehydrogenase
MNNHPETIDTPVILITGASSGIGAATARLFAQKGYRVALAARRMERLLALVAEIQGRGGQALAIQTDVSQLDAVNRMVEVVIKHWKQIDVLFNNAGFGRLDWLENLEAVGDVQTQIQVNLTGLIWSCQAVLPAMIARRQGQIINMASLSAFIAPPSYCVYAATKFGVRGFSESLRREVGVYNIQVSTIYPGAVETEFEEHTGAPRKTGMRTPSFLRLSSEQVARAVYRLARRPKRNLVIPWPMHVVIWGNSLFPGLVDKAMEYFFVRPERRV